MLKIDEGYTFELIFHSLILFVLGGLLCLFSIYIGFLMILIGILLCFNKTGTIIDEVNKKIGRYHSLFGKKRYWWISTRPYHTAILDFEFISQKMNSRGTSITAKSKTYELKFVGDKKETIFHEYSNYEISKEVLKAVHEKLNIKTRDKFLETQKSAYKRRVKQRR